MNKNIAVLVSVVMVVALAVTVVVPTDSDAVDKGTVYVLNGEDAEVNVQVTEPETSSYYNKITWMHNSVVLYGVDAKDDTVTGASGAATVSVSKAENVSGLYTITIEGTAVGTIENVVLEYKVETSLTEGGSAVSQSIEYTMNIVVLPSSVDIEGTKSFANGAELNSQSDTLTYVLPDKDEYSFYAIGLPNGLSMSSDGKIIGIPDDVATTYKVQVVLTHKDSNLAFREEIEITLTDGPNYGFGFTVYGGSESGFVKIDQNNYLTIQATEVSVEISGSSIDDMKVYIIDSNGAQTSVDETSAGSNSYSIDTTGTGEFTVVMENHGVVQNFNVTVIGVVTDIQTGIGFAPGYSIVSS